jgi:hypothetical protein
LENEQLKYQRRLELGIILVLIASLTPYVIFLTEKITIVAVAWILFISAGHVSIIFLEQTIPTLPFTFLRFMFVLQMIRLYDNKTTKKRTILVGVLSECPMLIFLVGNTLPLLWNPRWPYGFMGFSIPLLLLIGWLLMKYFPPPKVQDWLDREESWWPKIHVKE